MASTRRKFDAENTASAATSSAKLALMEEHPPVKFFTFAKMRASVDDRHETVAKDGNQYLSFNDVSPKLFEQVQKKRAELGRGVRVTYFPDIEVLVIKIPTKPQEKGHRNLGSMVDRAVYSMGIGHNEFSSLGATLYMGEDESQKEGDVSYTEILRHSANDWSCFVIEAGVSESLRRIQLTDNKHVQIEKYIPSAITTRCFFRTGTPLQLEYSGIFDRLQAPIKDCAGWHLRELEM